MTNREIDCVVMGFATGGTFCLWLGYKLRQRVERWQAGRFARHRERVRANEHSAIVGRSPRSGQDARSMLAKRQRVIPLERREPATRPASLSAEVIPIVRGVPNGDPSGYAVAPHWTSGDATLAGLAPGMRDDVISALTDLGYKKTEAVAAADACTLAERASGLESWIACALRRAKKP